MSSEVATLAIVGAIGEVRSHLCQRDFSHHDAVLGKFDGHAMMKLLHDVEKGSVELMQQRLGLVLAGLELGYQFTGAPLAQAGRLAGAWTPAQTVRLVGALPPLPAFVGRYKRIFERDQM